MPLEPSKKLAEVCSFWPYMAARRRRWRQPRQRRPHLAGAVAELSSERAAETRRICEAQILGDRRDRLFGRGIGQDRMRFEQPLPLNVSGDTSRVLEQPIKIGWRHSDKPAQDRRPEGRRP